MRVITEIYFFTVLNSDQAPFFKLYTIFIITFECKESEAPKITA